MGAREREEPTALDDAALMRGVQMGDNGSLTKLYERYAPLLLGLAIRILGGKAEAEDVLHDVFIEVRRRADTWDPARGSVRAWLVMRLRSRAIDRVRSPRLSRTVSFDNSSASRAAAPVAPSPTFAAERQRLLDAMESLTVVQRQCLTLVYLDGFKVREVAEKLGIPVGTVKSTMASARKKLRSLLKPRETTS